ncbi:hypothetical protein XBKQ1_2410007 [Xenorhabdus bovienii str. kraussei Quebec]|uniref:Uncharacterized protein n=1 Tax=Xenorhabdus bovienii str. kraussei Quebec TaxID=1398203 RepID=A0A077P6D1_XENBV|nr:hypothetical protein XBKQ1_2410007 [Xenorhabdus bovienii str. kraussei Quebec]
MPEKWRRKSI